MKRPTPNCFVFASLAVLALQGCLQTDAGRDDSLDEYDQDVGIFPSQVIDVATSPEGDLHVLISFSHVFTKSQISGDARFDMRYAVRNQEARIYTYRNRQWTRTDIQAVSSQDVSQPTFGFSVLSPYNNFHFDPESRPVLLSMHRLKPTLMGYRQGEWKTLWRGQSATDFPAPCNDFIWVDSSSVVGLCSSNEWNPQTGNIVSSSLYLIDGHGHRLDLARNQGFILGGDYRILKDTLDLMYRLSVESGSGTVSGTYTNHWVQIVRRPGQSFTVNPTRVKDGSPTQFGFTYFLPGDTRSRVFGYDSSQDYYEYRWEGDSLIGRRIFDATKANRITFSNGRDCIVGASQPQRFGGVDDRPMSQEGVKDTTLTAPKAADSALTWKFQTTCREMVPDLPVPSLPTSTYYFTRFVGSPPGDIWALHQYSTSSNYWALQDLSVDSAKSTLRGGFKDSLSRWQGATWEAVPWPF